MILMKIRIFTGVIGVIFTSVINAVIKFEIIGAGNVSYLHAIDLIRAKCTCAVKLFF